MNIYLSTYYGVNNKNIDQYIFYIYIFIYVYIYLFDCLYILHLHIGLCIIFHVKVLWCSRCQCWRVSSYVYGTVGVSVLPSFLFVCEQVGSHCRSALFPLLSLQQQLSLLLLISLVYVATEEIRIITTCLLLVVQQCFLSIEERIYRLQ